MVRSGGITPAKVSWEYQLCEFSDGVQLMGLKRPVDGKKGKQTLKLGLQRQHAWVSRAAACTHGCEQQVAVCACCHLCVCVTCCVYRYLHVSMSGRGDITRVCGCVRLCKCA